MHGDPVDTEAELAAARRRIAELTAALEAQAGPHRQADGAPLNSHQLLDALFENDHVLVAILDPEFRFVRVNRAYARADDREPGFFPGKGHFELYPNPENEAIFRRVVATGESHTALARPFQYAHAPERPLTYWDWTLAPHKGPDGRVVRLSLILVNVTERIRGLEIAAESEARYRSLAEAVPAGVFRTDARGRSIYVNEELCRLTGRGAAFIMGETWPEILHPDDRERVVREWGEAVVSGRVFEAEYRYRRPDGGVVWVYAKAVPERGPDGAVTGHVGSVTDITGRRRAQEALNALASGAAPDLEAFARESARHLARAYGAQYAFIGLLTGEEPERVHTLAFWVGGGYVENVTYDLTGTPCADIVAGRLTLVPEGVVERYPEDAILAEMGVESYFGAPLVGADGRTIGLVGVLDTRPMTLLPWTEPILGSFARRIAAEVERHRTERRLVENEHSLARAQRVARLGHWEWDIGTGALAWSDEIYRIFGLTPQEFGATYEAFLAAVHPDDQAFVQAEVNAAVDPGERKPYAIDHRIVLPDGEVRAVHEQGEVSFDPDTGAPLRMVGTVHDITAQRRAQDAMNALAEASAAGGMDAFHRVCVEALARAYGARHGFVALAEESDPTRLRTLAMWTEDRGLVENFAYPVAGTPCGDVLAGTPCAEVLADGILLVPEGAAARYPEDRELAELGVESYFGAPLVASDGRMMGVVGVMDVRPMRLTPWSKPILGSYARRIAAELERGRAEDELRKNEASLAHAQRIAHLGHWEWDAVRDVSRKSAEAWRILGLEPTPEGLSEEAFLERVHPDDRPAVRAAIDAALDPERRLPFAADFRIVRPSGETRHVHEQATVAFDASGRPLRMIGTIQDVTDLAEAEAERERTRAQLLQAQKMEAVGLLAGGVAHDFNNLLTTIMGYAELAVQRSGGPDDPLAAHLNEIRLAAERAASLTRQLLLFSRRQPMAFAALDVSGRVDALRNMLDRLIGEDVEVVTDLAGDLWPVRGDGVSIDQMLVNLAINARDAMPEGGRLAIRTENGIVSDADARAHPEAIAGRFVRVTVSDTGAGMDAETLGRVFEPFFTTKDPGKGTGLGMSVAHGIAKQHGGWIEAESAPGRGTTFRIHLPAAPHAVVAAEAPASAPAIADGGGRRVLVVEDEEALRAFARTALVRNGYQVVDVATAGEALELFEREGGEFALVFSDVVLPDRSGLKLVEELKARAPDLNVLLCSGYPDPETGWAAVEERDLPFIQKPYSLAALLAAVSDGIEGAPGGVPDSERSAS